MTSECHPLKTKAPSLWKLTPDLFHLSRNTIAWTLPLTLEKQNGGKSACLAAKCIMRIVSKEETSLNQHRKLNFTSHVAQLVWTAAWRALKDSRVQRRVWTPRSILVCSPRRQGSFLVMGTLISNCLWAQTQHIKTRNQRILLILSFQKAYHKTNSWVERGF